MVINKKTTKEKVFRRIEENREEIKKLGVKKLGLFGSVLKGKQKEKSDIDFLIEFENINADKFFNLLFLLERILNRKVDLVDSRNLRPELKYISEEAEYVQI